MTKSPEIPPKKRQFRTTAFLRKSLQSSERRHKALAQKVRRLKVRLEALEELVDPLGVKTPKEK